MKQYRGFWNRIPVLILAMMLGVATILLPLSSADAAYKSITVKNGGTITGVVTFKETPPAPQPIKVDKDKKVCGTTPMVSQALVVGKKKGIQNAVVRLTDITTGKPLPTKTVILDQKNCRFHPHVLMVPAGGSVEVVNDDPLTHNIHTFSFENAQVNQAQPKGSPKLTIKPTIPETIKVQCDIHKWMEGWIIVAAHPYYILTDTNGKFTLTNVPPGTYTLEIWHETLGLVNQTVTVKAQKSVNVSVTLPKKG